ncbi:hypothetical protein [Christensenella timonensis]|uniref:hypothetical protein n=1 Tax=Christensenella timonensis TaxID=1816678 RepID=UPI0011C8E1D2|nr:hypothetical protein [Christensenella timonensis]
MQTTKTGAAQNLGGIVGIAANGYVQVHDTYNAGMLKAAAAGNFVGGIAGNGGSATFTNNGWDGDVGGASYGVGAGNAAGTDSGAQKLGKADMLGQLFGLDAGIYTAITAPEADYPQVTRNPEEMREGTPPVIGSVSEYPAQADTAWAQERTLRAEVTDSWPLLGRVWCSTDEAGRENTCEMQLNDAAAHVYESVHGMAEGTYYVHAESFGGQRADSSAVAVGGIDTAAPLVSNVLFTDTGASGTKVTFEVTDTQSGVTAANIVWKTEADAGYGRGVTDEGNGKYSFETADDPNTAVHMIRATDNVGNTSEKRVLDEGNVLNVSVPVKLMFAVLPNTFGGGFLAPDYTVKNNSAFVKTKAIVTGMEDTAQYSGAENGFSLVAPGSRLAADEMVLYVKEASADAGAFTGMEKSALVPNRQGTFTPILLGVMDSKAQGKFTFAGDTPNYNIFSIPWTDIPTLRAGFSMTLKFEQSG